MWMAATKIDTHNVSRVPHPRLIGAIAATWMTAAMFGHRLFFGIASVPGLITERIIPLVPGTASGDILGVIDQFAKLIPELVRDWRANPRRRGGGGVVRAHLGQT